MVTPNRICPQCGAPLVPGEAFCSNCGTHYSGPSMTDPTQRASAPKQNPSNPSLPQIEPTQYAGPPPSLSPYGSGEQSFSPSLPPSNASYTSPKADYAPPPPVMPYGGTFEGYGQQSSMQPLGRRRGPNVWLIIGVILLLVLLVGGGIYFLSKGHSNSTNVVGKGTATATTQAGTPTPTTKPTPQPLFSDNFADNSKGWNTGSGSGFNSTIGNNELTLLEANHKILDEPIPGGSSTSATYTDFSVTTTFTILKADQNDSVGLYMRGDDNLTQGYFVDIFGDNTYDIVKVFSDSSKDTFLVNPTNSSAINSVGQQNKLTVIMKGPKIVLLINDKVVDSITDTGYTSGQIALFAENGKTSNEVNATFHSVMVYPAPEQLPG